MAPENIDAMRAVTAAEPVAADSIALTDETLGIRAEMIPRLAAAQARSTVPGEHTAGRGPRRTLGRCGR